MKALLLISVLSLSIGCTLYRSEGRKAIEDGSISLNKTTTFQKLKSTSENCATTNRLNFLLPYKRIAGIFTDEGLFEVYDIIQKSEQKVVVTFETNETISYCQYVFIEQFKTEALWTDFIEDAKSTLLPQTK